MNRKPVSCHLREPLRSALLKLKEKYDVSPTKVFEALLERDLLENEPEIAAAVGIERRAPNRFAAGGLSWNTNAASEVHYTGETVRTDELPRAPITSAWGDGGIVAERVSGDAEVPPSQRVRA